MQLTLYNQDDSIKATYVRSFVPWRLLKKAVGLSEQLNTDSMTAADLDALAGLVVEVFGDQFTVEDLNNGADISEMTAVLATIVAKAKGSGPNAGRPAQ